MLFKKEAGSDVTVRSFKLWTRLEVLAIIGVAAAFFYARVLSLVADAARYGWAIVPNVLSFTAGALAERAATLAAGIILFFIFWASGRVFSRALKLTPASQLESGVTAIALGTLLWGQLFLLLGLSGLLHVPFLRALLMAGGAAGLCDVVRHRPNVTAAWRELREAGDIWLGFLAVHLLILAPYALVPERFYDALVYHLGLPSLYLLRGRIGPVPDNAFSGIPALYSMIYGWALAVESGGHVAHLLNFGFLVASCLAILGLARRLGHPRAGGPAALIFATAPLAAGLAHLTGTELPWTFWQTAALLATLDASQTKERAGHWAAAGLIIGAVMSTKTLAWALPGAAFAAAWAKLGRRPSEKVLGWTGFAAVFMLSPWLIKDLFFYGNPIYPFFHEFFRPHAEIMPDWRYLGVGAGIPWSSGLALGIAAWLKTPLAALHPDSGDFMQLVNPVMLGLLPVGLWRAARSKEVKPAVWYAVLCWFPLSLVTNLPRFLFPVMPVFSLIAAFAIEDAPIVLRGLIFTISVCLAVFVWRRGFTPADHAVFTGQISESSYIEHGGLISYSTPLAPAARWLDKETAGDARVLVFGDSRGFYLTRDNIVSTPGQVTVLERWSNSSSDARALRARFAAEGVGYILVNHGEIFIEHHAFKLTLAGKKTLDEFWAHYTRKVFESGPDIANLSDGSKILDRWVVVYQVLSEEEAAKPHVSDDLFAAYQTGIGRP